MAPPETEPLRLDRQICFSLYAASNMLTRLYRPILSELGLTYPQYLVMIALWENAPQSVGSLGGKLHLDSGTLTPLLKRMEAAGLVSRDRDSKDERRVLIGLTAEGRALQAAGLNVPADLRACLDLGSMDVEQVRATVQQLVRILAQREDAAAA